jgi:hypothetical protein
MSGLEPLVIGGMVASAAGAGLSATGSIMAGREQARAAAYEQQQLQIQADNTRTAALQAETHRREELASSLETIAVMRGGRGVGAMSPTGLAILDSTTDLAERDIVTERTGLLQKVDQSVTGASLAGSRAKTSLLAGYLGAGEAIASGASRIAMLGRNPVGARTRTG